jgi:hypothetical protein
MLSDIRPFDHMTDPSNDSISQHCVPVPLPQKMPLPSQAEMESWAGVPRIQKGVPKTHKIQNEKTRVHFGT